MLATEGIFMYELDLCVFFSHFRSSFFLGGNNGINTVYECCTYMYLSFFYKSTSVVNVNVRVFQL